MRITAVPLLPRHRASVPGRSGRYGPPSRAALLTSLGTLALMALLPVGPVHAAGLVNRGTAWVGTVHVRRACPVPKPGHVACTALLRTNVPGHMGLFAPDKAPPGYGSSALQRAYDLPSATNGDGQTVALVGAYGDPRAEIDLQVYRAQYRLPPCTTANGCFEKVDQNGQQGNYPAPDPGWIAEQSLDADMVSAICPLCHIVLVEANSQALSDMYAAENEAVALGAKFVSNSWGTAEYAGEQQDAQQYLNHPGVAITAAGGDYGYLGRGTANWPASSQYVTSVGGTTLTRDSGSPRGWDESAWSGTGSGCSLYEPKPSWQHDSGCANRMTNDVSAVADPNTGVALYDSAAGGWLVAGGTSAATPVIASTYALAGPPAAGSYPSSYPYARPSALNDIISGSDGTCTPAYLCTAEPGYDGPTGLGTPDGIAAFAASGPHGQIAGQLTAKTTHTPIGGATVSVPGGYVVTTNTHGDFDLYLPAGSYDLTAKAFGYKRQTQDSVKVSQNRTTTVNFALASRPTVTLSGSVTDGAGHRWPLYAKITVGGDPHPVYSSPFTGRYSLSLPKHGTYQLQVSAVIPGYREKSLPVNVGTTARQDNFRLIPVSFLSAGCQTTPGYAARYTGGGTQFTGWTGSTPQDGWTVTANPGGNGATWAFGDNPTGEYSDPAPPGSDGQYAIADSNDYSNGTVDTSLVSPVVNLSGVSSPLIGFDSWYREFASMPERAEVDLSLDGGKTWSSVWKRVTAGVQGPVTVPIPQAAGQSQVRVRFTYAGTDDLYWSLDNVFIGTVQCAPIPGGLLAGQVSAASTATALNAATVTSVAHPTETAATVSAPAVGDGFYELFAAGMGRQRFAAAHRGYAVDTVTVEVASNAVTRQDFALRARQ